MNGNSHTHYRFVGSDKPIVTVIQTLAASETPILAVIQTKDLQLQTHQWQQLKD